MASLWWELLFRVYKQQNRIHSIYRVNFDFCFSIQIVEEKFIIVFYLEHMHETSSEQKSNHRTLAEECSWSFKL